MNPCEILRNNLLEMLNSSKDYQQTIKFMCVGQVPRQLWLSKYKSLPPIEAFPQEEKKEWKKFVNEIFPEKPPEFRLDAVKIIYTIGVLTN